MGEAGSGVCPVLVGRTAEIERIRLAVAASEQVGAIITVLGEAGIGKSRVSAEAAGAGAARGAITLIGQCSERAQTAYAPVASALRGYTRTLGAAGLQGLFGGAAKMAASLVPEAAESLGLTITPGVAAEHLFAALWHVFRRLRATAPVLLLVEDVHWADADTLDMLMYLAREAEELQLCLVINGRPEELHAGHPLVPVLSALRRLPWQTEVALQPLQRDGVEQMLIALLDRGVDGALVDAMLLRTGGVPYFIEELAAALPAEPEGEVPTATGGSRAASTLPLSLRDALLSRLQSLTPEDVRLLQLAAVAGERVDRRLLAAAAQTDLDHVDGVIEGAVRCNVLIEVLVDGVVRYAFRHALMRDVLIAELPASKRRKAHRHIADALVAMRHGDTAAVAAELTQHYQEADDPAHALHFALQAARHASGRVAPAETLEQFHIALRLAAEVGADDLPILLDAADAATRTEGSHADGGLRLAQQARDRARERGAAVDEGRALNLISRHEWRQGHMDDAIELSKDALALIRGGDDAAEADTLARLVMWLAQAGRRETVPALIDRGTSLATSSGNLRALADLQQSAGLCADGPVDAEEAFASSIRAARAAGDVEREIDTLSTASMTALLHGRILRACEMAERAVALVDGEGEQAPLLYMMLAFHQALAGDLDGALRCVNDLGHAAVNRASVQTRTTALRALAEVYLRRGDTQRALAVADDALRLAQESGAGMELSLATHVRIHLALDDDPPGTSVEPFLDGRWQPQWLLSPLVARHLVRRHDVEALSRLVDRVGEWTAAREVTMSRGPGATAAFEFCSGLLALQVRDLNAARTLLDKSARLFAELPMPARRVEALIALAQAHVDATERRRAVTTLLEARQIAHEMTAWALEKEVTRTLRRLGIRSPRPSERQAARSGLSEKEADVAVLIASGFGNSEIAEKLVISPRTVANHVSNILAKLELHNRSEVARWAMAHNLTASPRTAEAPFSEPHRFTVLKAAGGRRSR